MQLPEELNAPNAKSFLQELDPLLESHRPRIILDCSQVHSMDSAGVEMLLHCLEEAMKRDGDLKLCAVSPQSEVILEFMRVDRVFEVFVTSEDAVRSFAVAPDVVAQDSPWYGGVLGEAGILKQAS
jgi:anti-sigma B factor antagonist